MEKDARGTREGETSVERAQANQLQGLLKHAMLYPPDREAIDNLLEKRDPATVLYALDQLRRPWRRAEITVETHRAYVEKLVAGGSSPHHVLAMLNEKWVPSDSVLRNRRDYIQMYNERTGAKRTILTTLRDYLGGNEHDVALVVSHLRHQGGRIGDKLFQELGLEFAQRYTLAQVFELTTNEHTLLTFLEEKLPVHVLAHLLAEAGKVHSVAGRVLALLVVQRCDRSFEDVVRELHLQNAAALTPNNLKPLQLYTRLVNKYRNAKINLPERVAALHNVEVTAFAGTLYRVDDMKIEFLMLNG
ncbi:hypothetical protein PsorP6_012470 [Peronosclerospora sorghi]|uniref:Uncharacterized protein n=1 Tax=Peronosclerospora sorghi TaxID=230839 RepID=A0ACC0WGT6_9STRA|nr:hypothetical protein PsorP6_012470 [Peronosclerospora sorghi]